jgi:hypothetical protein
LQTIIPELDQGEEYNLPYRLSTCKGSSPGPDDVHYEMLKQLLRVAKLKLLEIHNEIWEREVFPKSWTEATVIPILKSQEKTRTKRTAIDQYHSQVAYVKQGKNGKL